MLERHSALTRRKETYYKIEVIVNFKVGNF